MEATSVSVNCSSPLCQARAELDTRFGDGSRWSCHQVIFQQVPIILQALRGVREIGNIAGLPNALGTVIYGERKKFPDSFVRWSNGKNSELDPIKFATKLYNIWLGRDFEGKGAFIDMLDEYVGKYLKIADFSFISWIDSLADEYRSKLWQQELDNLLEGYDLGDLHDFEKVYFALLLKIALDKEERDVIKHNGISYCFAGNSKECNMIVSNQNLFRSMSSGTDKSFTEKLSVCKNTLIDHGLLYTEGRGVSRKLFPLLSVTAQQADIDKEVGGDGVSDGVSVSVSTEDVSSEQLELGNLSKEDLPKIKKMLDRAEDRLAEIDYNEIRKTALEQEIKQYEELIVGCKASIEEIHLLASTRDVVEMNMNVLRAIIGVLE